MMIFLKYEIISYSNILKFNTNINITHNIKYDIHHLRTEAQHSYHGWYRTPRRCITESTLSWYLIPDDRLSI